MFTLIIVLFFFNILCEIIEINPESKIKFKDVKYNEEILLKVPRYKLKENTFYNIRVHFIGSIGIKINFKIICDDIYPVINKNNEIILTEVNERSFFVNKKKIPTLCNNKFDKNFFLLSLKTYSKVYHFNEEKYINFPMIIELVSFKGGVKLKPFISSGFYKVLILNFIIIPIILIIFRNKIRGLLLKALFIKDIKSN